MTTETFTLRVATQRLTGGALVSVGDVDVEGGELRVLVGVGAPVATGPTWLARGAELTSPGWGMLRVVDVQIAGPSRAAFEFASEAGL